MGIQTQSFLFGLLMRIVLVVLFILGLGLYLLLSSSVAPLVSKAHAGGIIPDKYDSHFWDASVYLPAGTDWRLLKAQCWQESRLNPLAVSPVGAMGVCQFMPATAGDMQRKYPDLEDFWLPETSIMAAGIYMGDLNRFWSSPRPTSDRYKLALASYNAGAGHLVKAQRLADGSVYYDDISCKLPLITGRHSKETLTYVNLIVNKWYPLTLLD